MDMQHAKLLIEMAESDNRFWCSLTGPEAQAVIDHGAKSLRRTDGKHGLSCYFSTEPLEAVTDDDVVLEFVIGAAANVLDLDDDADRDVWEEGRFDALAHRDQFRRLLREAGIDGVRQGEEACIFRRKHLTFERVVDGIVSPPKMDRGGDLDEVALGGLKRCTAVTLNALLSHYSRPGITLSEVPETGEGLLQVLLKHGLAYKPVPMVAGRPVQQFAAQHPTGSWYVVTPGHAMALVDGELFDAENKGPDGRKVVTAMQVTRR